MKPLRTCLLLPVLLAACSQVPGPIAQLDRFKTAEAAKNYSAIEAEPVNADCNTADKSEACPQLFEIHARACLRLVAAETPAGAACPAPSDAVRRRLDCAASGFAAARDSGSFSTVQSEDFTDMRAHALYCGATLRDTSEGVPLARTSLAELATLPATPERDHAIASAALNIANREDLPQAQRCDAARQAVRAAEWGLTGTPAAAIADGLRGARGAARGIITRLRCGST